MEVDGFLPRTAANPIIVRVSNGEAKGVFWSLSDGDADEFV